MIPQYADTNACVQTLSLTGFSNSCTKNEKRVRQKGSNSPYFSVSAWLTDPGGSGCECRIVGFKKLPKLSNTFICLSMIHSKVFRWEVKATGLKLLGSLECTVFGTWTTQQNFPWDWDSLQSVLPSAPTDSSPGNHPDEEPMQKCINLKHTIGCWGRDNTLRDNN